MYSGRQYFHTLISAVNMASHVTSREKIKIYVVVVVTAVFNAASCVRQVRRQVRQIIEVIPYQNGVVRKIFTSCTCMHNLYF